MSDARQRSTTIKDVAAAAGVSYQTVSRVLNNKGEVRPETQRRVLDAVNALKYTPDPVARSLVGRNSFTIGVVIATFTGHTCNLTLQSSERYFRALGYNLVIVGTETHSSAEPDAGLLLSRQRLEGLLVIYHGAQDDPHRLLQDVPPDIPIVSTGYLVERPDARVIQIDTRDGAILAMRHLLEIGHRRIATITGSPRASEANQRLDGYRAVLEENGLVASDDLIAHGDWSIAGGFRAAQELLSRRSTRFSALFVQNDSMALGAMRAIHEAGLRVPTDISIVGFDDAPTSACSIPSITTVSYPAAELGEYAAELLYSMIQQRGESGVPHEQRSPPLRMQLVVRESTGAPSKS
jgi:LacI family transcriptional regulator